MRVLIRKDRDDPDFYHVYYECGSYTRFLGSFHQDNLADIATGQDTSWYENLMPGEDTEGFLYFSQKEIPNAGN